MAKNFIIDLSDARIPATIGNKARNLRLLMEKGFPVPDTLVLTWDAFNEYCSDHVDLVAQLQAELQARIAPGSAYAVRSSANIEDSLAYSFAGQFKSALGVTGSEAILQAVWSIWGMALSPQVQTYLEKLPDGQHDLRMAVLIQQMVRPVISGVAFSRNPINGMDEIVVEAVQGSGDALVQSGLTPGRWIYKWGRFVNQPEETPIARDVILQVVQQVRRATGVFKRDVDIEWVYDGRSVQIVQMRDITAIGSVTVYSNAIAKDMLPGLIRPLIWSINFPLMAGAWKQALTEVLGSNDIQALDLARLLHYRAYFNMTVFGQVFNRLGLPGETLDLMMGVGPGGAQMPKVSMRMGMLRLMPRLAGMMWDKWRFHKQLDAMLEMAGAARASFQPDQAAGMEAGALLDECDRLVGVLERMVYGHMMGQILMYMYDGILRGQLKKMAVDVDQFDLLAGYEAIRAYDPGVALAGLHAQYCRLEPAAQERIVACQTLDDFEAIPGMADFQAAFARFLEQFGHLSDSGNDFSCMPWRETPALVLRMVANHRAAQVDQSGRPEFDALALRGPRRLAIRILHDRARLFRLYREKVGHAYTSLYGLLRVYYRALGERLANAGKLHSPEDIFFLYRDEVRAAVTGEAGGFAAQAALRAQEMEALRDAPLPDLIYGDQAPPVLANLDHRLTGTPSSRGYYTGPARVVRGIQDFDKVQNGDVLVVPFSDIGWTPLFARAGGVVAESGGMLSHSAIIAREYRIPAVVSVNGALSLCDGALVTVDGYKGEVLIHVSSSPAD